MMDGTVYRVTSEMSEVVAG